MIKEKQIFIMHVLRSVESQLTNHGGVIAAAEFSPKVYQDILMFLPEIKAQAREIDIDIEEEVIPEALLVIKI